MLFGMMYSLQDSRRTSHGGALESQSVSCLSITRYKPSWHLLTMTHRVRVLSTAARSFANQSTCAFWYAPKGPVLIRDVSSGPTIPLPNSVSESKEMKWAMPWSKEYHMFPVPPDSVAGMRS